MSKAAPTNERVVELLNQILSELGSLKAEQQKLASRLDKVAKTVTR